MTPSSVRRFRWPALPAVVLIAVLWSGAVVEPAAAVDAHYRRQITAARGQLLRGSATEAARLYKEILARKPADEQASSGYAEALLKLEKLDEAEAFLAEALEVVEPKTDLYRKRVSLRRLQDRPEDAFGDALRVLTSNDALASWVFQTTRDLIADGLDSERAIEEARAAREENPDDASLAVLTGVILGLGDRHEEAKELLIAFDEQKKQRGRGLQEYAEEMLGLGYRETAMDALLVAAERANKSSRRTQILFSVAEMLEQDERYTDALDHLQTIATEREGTSSAGKALIRSAEIYQNHLEDPRGALQVYEKLEHDPSLGHYRPEMLLQMGDCYAHLGRFQEAAKTYESVLPEALDPEHAEAAAYKLAEVAFYSGEADSALVLYQEMAETYPRSLLTNEAAGRYILVNTYTALGGGQALSWFGRMEWSRSIGDSAGVDSLASALITGYPASELAAEARLARAELSEEAGQWDAALQRLETVLERHGTDRRAPIALMRQAEIYLNHLDDPAAALERYERILAEYPQSVLVGEARHQVQTLRQSL